METTLKVVTYLVLTLFSVVIVGSSGEELPHGEPNEELVEKHHGSKARIHH
jgi:hypothetical protein